MRSWLVSVALASTLVATPAFVRADEPMHQQVPGEDLEAFVPGAARLEGRIMAPCCWMQTIDIHGSEVAYDLRHEIRHRLKQGESPEAIEASLVERYGPKILAVPPSSQLGNVALLLAAMFGGGGIGALLLLRRWKQRGDGDKAAPPKASNDGGPDAAPH